MSHYAYRALGQVMELEADYVIVGSGPGGSTVAVDLARGGASVALVEAGAWRDPQDYPHSMYGTLRDTMDDWGSLVTRGRAFWPVIQARTVGGGTVINSAIVVRTPGDIFKLWDEEHGFGGDAMAEKIWRYQDELNNELHVSQVPREKEGMANFLARKGAQALGIHDHDMHRNIKDCLGKGDCLQGCKEGRKQSTNLNFIPEMIRLGSSMISCAPVAKVVLEGNRAVGVQGHFHHPSTRKKGDAFFIRGKKGVIIAASATHSPALLLRSGVKHPALGHSFRAHPGTGIFGCYDEPVDMNTGATQGWSSMALRESNGLKLETLSLPLELVASRLSGGGTILMERLAEYRHITMCVQATRAETRGRVTAGLFGKPVVHYSLTTDDMKRMRIGAHWVARMHFEAGAKAVLPGVQGLPYKMTADQIDSLLEAPPNPRHWTGILSHLFGGCVMGADAKRAVCDERGLVYGYKGLFISDASAIPTTLGVNPQHTIMALSRLRAHQLLDS